MKAKLFHWSVVANIAPIVLCFLYEGGGLLLFMLFPPLHILLFLLNNRAAQTWKQVVVLGLLHMIVTVCTHQLSGWLYSRFLTDDIAGRAIYFGGALLGLAFTIVLFIISLLMFYMKSKKQSARK